ncbi:MAG: hypothetical protein KF716_13015 [Anaerolineae bacterium]|nr:hypothetical protein [Anaerolineae bacterium]
MQRWEYQTLVVKIGREKQVEVVQLNNKEAKAVEPGGLFKEPMYHDLPTYLAQVGQDGWEVAGTAPLTHTIPGSGTGDGRNRVMIILKRPLE